MGQAFKSRPTIKIAVAARPEFAQKPPRREGLVVVIPYAEGDMTAFFRKVDGLDAKADFALDRPNIYEFKKALASIGIDEADAERLALGVGRSWSVFRRRRALNPSIDVEMLYRTQRINRVVLRPILSERRRSTFLT